MPTKNAHHTHENASGQNATLPIFLSARFRAPPLWNTQSDEFPTFSNESNKPKHKQNAAFSTHSKNEEKVQ